MFVSKSRINLQHTQAAASAMSLDPLEQFDVLLVPVLGCVGFTNLALLLILNLVLMAA